ncbi:C-terminal binding protein [Clostridium sp. KNHs216]|uniref:C-terminal binding protein n=1 Tax=Clostridium sp. KNHs216 TaxID=1550235 RepID=UPI00114DE994|nr:C-terminal binding protein [Clostridium sp. KNHs216]TQI68327.1 D-3-phosphoglycerate dehydrogenase [Clostridium sp. KNHs216]
MKVVITDFEYPNVDQEIKIITESGAELMPCHLKSEDEIIAAVKDADAVIVQYADITKNIIDRMERCKVIIRYGIGVNNIDSDAATSKGIYVCNVPDYGVDEVSNHAISMLMALIKKLPVITKALRGGDWGYTSTVPLFRMAGSTLGLVGLGRIPSLVAKKMAGFDVRILAFDPYVTAEDAEKRGVRLVDFETLCKESDFISIHCPLTASTTHMFDKNVFQMMKKTAYLINTSRGPVINEKDLIEALRTGEIAGAGLDVYEKEPISSDSELLKMDNVIATPHSAWYSEEAISTLQRKVAEEVVNILGGGRPINCTNKALLK